MPDILDVFHWKMNATEHKRSVDSLRLDIIEAYENHIPLPISLILQLLPLQTEQGGDAAARGDITFEGNVWTNEADDDLWMEFQDPVMQTFSATIPRIWTGSLDL